MLPFRNPLTIQREMTRGSVCTTKELSVKTLTDFERLFESHPAPGAHPCRCMYNQRPCPLFSAKELHSPRERYLRNRREKRELVRRGWSHGILVYAGSEPVAWCQFGRDKELPRIENNPEYRKLVAGASVSRTWRVTCFVVNRKYRRMGIASTALKAALKAIEKRGGGVVEAYPITHWGPIRIIEEPCRCSEKKDSRLSAPSARTTS